MVLLIKSGGPSALPEWQSLFAGLIPDLTVRGWHETDVDPESVRYVIVWEPEAGRIAQYPQCRAILSSAAGVDHILADPDLPKHLPIVRMVTTETAERMADYVTMATYALIRDLPKIIAAQSETRWDLTYTGRMASETTVAILGLGQLGSAAATRLAANGFRVTGWSRSPKTLPGVECHIGEAGFEEVLSTASVLVNLLPDTEITRGLINADVFAKLPKGAAVINVGRGTQLNSADLIAALDSGHLSGAMLDVFATEPLPQDDPLWRHPGVIVTGHVASAVSRKAKAQQAAAAILADMAGSPIAHLYDHVRGY